MVSLATVQELGAEGMAISGHVNMAFLYMKPIKAESRERAAKTCRPCFLFKEGESRRGRDLLIPIQNFFGDLETHCPRSSSVFPQYLELVSHNMSHAISPLLLLLSLTPNRVTDTSLGLPECSFEKMQWLH